MAQTTISIKTNNQIPVQITTLLTKSELLKLLLQLGKKQTVGIKTDSPQSPYTGFNEISLQYLEDASLADYCSQETNVPSLKETAYYRRIAKS